MVFGMASDKDRGERVAPDAQEARYYFTACIYLNGHRRAAAAEGRSIWINGERTGT